MSTYLTIDEGCYIGWGMLGEAVPLNWIGMKVIPAWLIRELMAAVGDGESGLRILQAVFFGFSALLCVGVVAWRRVEGDHPLLIFLATGLLMTSPGIVY